LLDKKQIKKMWLLGTDELSEDKIKEIVGAAGDFAVGDKRDPK
jgi:hypothetical protein